LPGARGQIVLNVTLPGATTATLYHVLYDKWADVAEWTLLVLMPVDEVTRAVLVDVSNDEINLEAVLVLWERLLPRIQDAWMSP